MTLKNGLRSRAKRLLGLVSSVGLAGAATGASIDLHAYPAANSGTVSPDTIYAPESALTSLTYLDSLFGRSGKLRARFVGTAAMMPLLSPLFGDTAGSRAGIYAVNDSARNTDFAFITLRPFTDKKLGRIGSYRIGYWPFERRKAAVEDGPNPSGFVEVTPENQDTYISTHFRLRDFLTHDQENVWPKYLVLNERLIDKLELVIAELESQGLNVEHMSVMSGFRTPQYNVRGVGKRGGRAKDSRHQYGDAADVYVDNNGDGRMDDLNRDGRVDIRDARVLLNAADRVEEMHPELAGGVGVYSATRAHGPFAHIDARGNRARWGKI